MNVNPVTDAVIMWTLLCTWKHYWNIF